MSTKVKDELRSGVMTRQELIAKPGNDDLLDKALSRLVNAREIAKLKRGSYKLPMKARTLMTNHQGGYIGSHTRVGYWWGSGGLSQNMIIPRQLALLGAPCRFLGVAVQQRSGRRVGGITGQAARMGHRIFLWQHRTESGIVDGYCRDFGV